MRQTGGNRQESKDFSRKPVDRGKSMRAQLRHASPRHTPQRQHRQCRQPRQTVEPQRAHDRRARVRTGRKHRRQQHRIGPGPRCRPDFAQIVRRGEPQPRTPRKPPRRTIPRASLNHHDPAQGGDPLQFPQACHARGGFKVIMAKHQSRPRRQPPHGAIQHGIVARIAQQDKARHPAATPILPGSQRIFGIWSKSHDAL